MSVSEKRLLNGFNPVAFVKKHKLGFSLSGLLLVSSFSGAVSLDKDYTAERHDDKIRSAVLSYFSSCELPDRAVKVDCGSHDISSTPYMIQPFLGPPKEIESHQLYVVVNREFSEGFDKSNKLSKKVCDFWGYQTSPLGVEDGGFGSSTRSEYKALFMECSHNSSITFFVEDNAVILSDKPVLLEPAS